MKIISSRAAALLFCCILLQACGTKGPLYLPKPEAKPAAVPAANPAATPAETEQQRK